MSGDVSVTIYIGPRFWFDEQTASVEATHFMELIDARDAKRRQYIVRDERDTGGWDDDDEEAEPMHVVVASDDYSTLAEGWLNNFGSLVRDVNPASLHVQNPPRHVMEQLKQLFNATVKEYPFEPLTMEKLARIRRQFPERVVGQEEVMARILPALYPLTSPSAERPVVLMMYGPSGVGKTETARLINDILGGSLLRLQFSMYHSDRFASYIFGGKPSERSLAQDLLDRESGVILIDEFDKAHSMFHSAFYEMFDEGVFVDTNYRVHLGPALIICTSNYASEKDVRSELGDALSSRFTAMIEYSSLSVQAVGEIAASLVSARFLALSDDDRAHIDLERVQRALGRGPFGNVRTLTKAVDEMMSHMVVNAALDAYEAGEAGVASTG